MTRWSRSVRDKRHAGKALRKAACSGTGVCVLSWSASVNGLLLSVLDAEVGPLLSQTSRGQTHSKNQGVYTLNSHVFDRSRFHAQKNYNWTHKGTKLGILKGVVPIQRTRAHFGDNLLH